GAVAEASAALLVDDLVVLRLHLAHGHAPLGGGGRLQHAARGGTAAAHGLEEMPRAARAVGVLVAVALLVARGLHHAHALPVRLQLVGHDHGHARAHTLSHLGAVTHDGHGAIVADGHEDERIVHPAVGHAVSAVLRGVGGPRERRETGGEDEAAQRGHTLKEAPAA